jgi:hypothetical protein
MPENRTEPLCVLCDEPMGFENSASSIQPMHRACSLRNVVGGIGHLVAHPYWCIDQRDPDAGLTYRQSALLVDAFVTIVGVEQSILRG